jgi:hypothetical protein
MLFCVELTSGQQIWPSGDWKKKKKKKKSKKTQQTLVFCNCWLLQTPFPKSYSHFYLILTPPITYFGGAISLSWLWHVENGVILKSTDPKNLISCMFITTMVYTEGGFRGFRWRQVCWRVQYWVLKCTTGAMWG